MKNFLLMLVSCVIVNSEAQNLTSRGTNSIGISNIVIIEAAPNGDQWVGSSTDGAARFIAAKDSWFIYDKSVAKTNLPSNKMTGFELFPNGATVCATDKGITVTNPNGNWKNIPALAGQNILGTASRGDSLWVIAGNTVKRFIFDPSDTSFNLSNTKTVTIPGTVTVMSESDGACDGFWLGTNTAGCHYMPEDTIVMSLSTTSQNLVNNAVNDIEAESDCSRIFVGTQGGFSICPIDGSASCQNFTTANGLPQNYIKVLAIGCSGNVLLGTKDSGLVVYNLNSGTFTRITKSKGLTDNRILAIDEEDDCGFSIITGDNNMVFIDSNLKIEKLINNIVNTLAERYIVSIFPNPASQMIHFDFEKQFDQCELTIVDISGKEVLRSNYTNSRKIVVDISALPKSNYIYQLSIDNEKNKVGRFDIN